MSQKANLEWEKLGFSYVKTPWRYVQFYKDGVWNEGKLVEENHLSLHEGSPALHYGQQCFEGLKAQTTPDGRVLLFRPYENARRMAKSCEDLLMAFVGEEAFVQACIEVCRKNKAYIPPYGKGASFYLRPFTIGIGENLGVRPAREYLFSVFGSPVGPYFKGGMQPVKFITSSRDRAAPWGTGSVKVGGNYAASLHSHEIAVKLGYADCIYLDPLTHTKIEEVGAANFFGITHQNVFVTPKSNSILPSITKYSLMYIAEHILGMKVEERDVFIESLDEFAEAGACGTAAVITPIGLIHHQGKDYTFQGGDKIGPVTMKLYETLMAIQRGERVAPEGWMIEV